MGNRPKGQKSILGKRKHNAGVGVDFKRVKHKVGKKLKKAQNETNVDFKARSINLPSQALQQDKEGVAVNFHNLTLKELLNQTAHYSDKTRKSALAGLADLFQRHPEEVKQHTHQLLPRLAERAADADSSVRLALRSLLRDVVLPLVDNSALRPFMPVIMAHVCGAMTHLSLDIRMDALNLLDVLMDHCPELVVPAFLTPCLAHFCDLLSSAHRGRNIKAQSVSALLKVLTALDRFLLRAYPASAKATNMDGPATGSGLQSTSSTQSTAATAAAGPSTDVGCSLFASRCAWPPRLSTDLLLLGSSAASPADSATHAATTSTAVKQKQPPSQGLQPQQIPVPAIGSSGQDGGSSGAEAVGHRLIRLMYECWPECSPGLSSGGEAEPVQALVAVLQASQVLINELLAPKPQGAHQHTQPGPRLHALSSLSHVILKHVAPRFPATAPTVKANAALSDALVQYNLQAAQLLAMFLPLCTATAAQAAHPQLQQPPQPGPAKWVQTLLDYYVGVLDHGVLLPAHSSLLSEATTGVAVPAAAYTSVLQGIAAVVPLVVPEQGERLMTSVVRLCERLPARSAVQAECLYVQRPLLNACLKGEMHLRSQQLLLWLNRLPKLLWEVGDSSPGTSSVALAMLHDAGRLTPPGTPFAAAVAKLQRQLAPLFCTQLPAPKPKKRKHLLDAGHGSQQPPGSSPQAAASAVQGGACPACAAAASAPCAQMANMPTLVLGPLSKLPMQLQLMAVDVLYHLGPPDRVLLKALLPVLQSRLFADDMVLRLLEVLLLRIPSQDPVLVASWLLSLLFGPAAEASGAGPAAAAAAAVPGVSTSSAGEPGSNDAAGGWGWPRQQQVVDMLCCMLLPYGSVGSLLQLMLPHLLERLSPNPAAAVQPQPQPQMESLQSYALLQLVRLAVDQEHTGSLATQPEQQAVQPCDAQRLGCMDQDQPTATASHSTQPTQPTQPASHATSSTQGPGSYEERGVQQRQAPSNVPSQLWQAMPDLLAGFCISKMQGKDTESAVCRHAAALALQWLQTQPALVPPVLQACASYVQQRQSRAANRQASAAASTSGAAAAADTTVGQAEPAASSQLSHSPKCFEATFIAAAMLVQHLLKAPKLQQALLASAGQVQAALAALLAAGQQHAQAHLNSRCTAECQQLEQLRTDLFGH